MLGTECGSGMSMSELKFSVTGVERDEMVDAKPELP